MPSLLLARFPAALRLHRRRPRGADGEGYGHPRGQAPGGAVCPCGAGVCLPPQRALRMGVHRYHHTPVITALRVGVHRYHHTPGPRRDVPPTRHLRTVVALMLCSFVFVAAADDRFCREDCPLAGRGPLVGPPDAQLYLTWGQLGVIRSQWEQEWEGSGLGGIISR